MESKHGQCHKLAVSVVCKQAKSLPITNHGYTATEHLIRSEAATYRRIATIELVDGGHAPTGGSKVGSRLAKQAGGGACAYPRHPAHTHAHQDSPTQARDKAGRVGH
jgi:hypothetical protein